ncbi:MAG: patatin-like phospholipase family protein [Anaerolineae bacterium]|nr:MAG: patatin-like phospholipase family protein [Anaerolineae bacterium]
MSPTTAIVMSGGGSKGAFQVGALKRMYEVGIRPQIVCGTSVGALNGAKLAENSETVISELETLWLSLQGNEDVLALATGGASCRRWDGSPDGMAPAWPTSTTCRRNSNARCCGVASCW